MSLQFSYINVKKLHHFFGSMIVNVNDSLRIVKKRPINLPISYFDIKMNQNLHNFNIRIIFTELNSGQHHHRAKW